MHSQAGWDRPPRATARERPRSQVTAWPSVPRSSSGKPPKCGSPRRTPWLQRLTCARKRAVAASPWRRGLAPYIARSTYFHRPACSSRRRPSISRFAITTGQQVVEVVGNSAGQLPDYFHFLGLAEHILGPLAFRGFPPQRQFRLVAMANLLAQLFIGVAQLPATAARERAATTARVAPPSGRKRRRLSPSPCPSVRNPDARSSRCS